MVTLSSDLFRNLCTAVWRVEGCLIRSWMWRSRRRSRRFLGWGPERPWSVRGWRGWCWTSSRRSGCRRTTRTGCTGWLRPRRRTGPGTQGEIRNGTTRWVLSDLQVSVRSEIASNSFYCIYYYRISRLMPVKLGHKSQQ